MIGQMKPYLIYIISLVIIIILGIAVIIYSNSINKKRKEALQKEAGELIKIFVKLTYYGALGSQINILSVNGKKPVKFITGLSSGVYGIQGENILNIQFLTSMYKAVSKKTNSVNIKVNLELGKEYILYFDKKVGFKLEEKK